MHTAGFYSDNPVQGAAHAHDNDDDDNQGDNDVDDTHNSAEEKSCTVSLLRFVSVKHGALHLPSFTSVKPWIYLLFDLCPYVLSSFLISLFSGPIHPPTTKYYTTILYYYTILLYYCTILYCYPLQWFV